jgi:hypothetical protein
VLAKQTLYPLTHASILDKIPHALNIGRVPLCVCLSVYLCVCVCVHVCVIFIVLCCVNFFALSNTFSYSNLFHTHWVYPLLRHAEDSLNQNFSLTLWNEVECTRMSGVQWLLVLLNVAIQQIEGKKFIYKITIRISPICVCVCVCVCFHCWSFSITDLWNLCSFLKSLEEQPCVALSLCPQFCEWKVYCVAPQNHCRNESPSQVFHTIAEFRVFLKLAVNLRAGKNFTEYGILSTPGL